jgi:phosphoadenosine phosphosulfate reductase
MMQKATSWAREFERPAESLPALEAWAQFLNARWEGASAAKILSEALHVFFPGRIAVVSSFGADAAVLLHCVAERDRSVPVLFLDTLKHFDETLTYRDILIDRFGFADARSLTPDANELAQKDCHGELWRTDPDRCCTVRKVKPLAEALAGFSAWITGRKRHQSADRIEMPIVEVASGRIKINPLAHWSEEEVRQAFKSLSLPAHPLFDEGYASIGCAPCTRRMMDGEHVRAGRWSGTDKSECGIHRL